MTNEVGRRTNAIECYADRFAAESRRASHTDAADENRAKVDYWLDDDEDVVPAIVSGEREPIALWADDDLLVGAWLVNSVKRQRHGTVDVRLFRPEGSPCWVNATLAPNHLGVMRVVSIQFSRPTEQWDGAPAGVYADDLTDFPIEALANMAGAATKVHGVAGLRP